jgi:hypothetical protein
MFNFASLINSEITNKRIQTEDIKVFKNNSIRLGDPLVKLLALSSISQEITNEEGERETLVAHDRVRIADSHDGIWLWKSEASIVDDVDVTAGVKLNSSNKFSSQTVSYSLHGENSIWKHVDTKVDPNTGISFYKLECTLDGRTVENVEEIEEIEDTQDETSAE